MILFQIDAEKGDGVDAAKEFHIIGYPTFVMLNGEGQVIDRWLGYSGDNFAAMLATVLTDPATIDQKTARFEATPNEIDAVTLGRYYSSLGDYTNAVKYYRAAQNLRTTKDTDYSWDLFESTIRGIPRSQFTYDDAAQAAESIFVQGTPAQAASAANRMSELALKQGKSDDMARFLKTGLDVSVDDPESKPVRDEMQIAYALYIAHDTATAIQNKKATLGQGWTEDADQLNEFAWWCYENNINLNEAETLSHKAVQLAQPGRSKAMILDTEAHVLKAKSDLLGAIKVMELAVTEDPEDKQWSETLQDFREELEGQKPAEK